MEATPRTNERLDRIDERLDAMNRRHDHFDHELNRINDRIDGLAKVLIGGVLALSGAFMAGFVGLIVLFSTQS